MTDFDLFIKPARRAGRQLRFSGPSDWSEVSAFQAIALMRIRMSILQQSRPGTPDVLFPALRVIYNLKPRYQRWLFDDVFLRAKGLDAPERPVTLESGSGDGERETVLKMGQLLIDTVRWIGLTEPGTAFLVPRFRRFDFRFGSPAVLLGRLRHRQSYFAPGEALADATFEEFMWADKAYRDQNLPLLAAVLYRPGKAGAREPLASQSLKIRAARFADLDPALLALIAAHYEATLAYLQTCFRYVFPTAAADQSGNKTGNWLDVVINMAKLDATKIGQIEQLNLYLALKVLNEELRQAEAYEEAIEKMKKS